MRRRVFELTIPVSSNLVLCLDLALSKHAWTDGTATWDWALNRMTSLALLTATGLSGLEPQSSRDLVAVRKMISPADGETAPYGSSRESRFVKHYKSVLASLKSDQ